MCIRDSRPSGAGASGFASATKASVNASGKKVYDREFMLSIREACTDRPAGLTADLKIEGGVAMEPKGGGRGGGQGPPGVDQWRTAGGGRGGGRGGPANGGGFDPRAGPRDYGKRGQQPMQGGNQRRGFANMQPVKPLEKSENAYVRVQNLSLIHI